MANLVSYVHTLVKPYYFYILAVLLVFIFIVVARFAYQSYYVKMKKNRNFTDVANTNNHKPIVAIYFFHVDWCPHCVKAVPEWNAFFDAYNNKEVNGHVVKCYDIDCTDDNGDEVIQLDASTGSSTGVAPTPIKIVELIKKYNIDSYPTIKLTKDDVVVQFDAKVTKQNLIQFVNSV